MVSLPVLMRRARGGHEAPSDAWTPQNVSTLTYFMGTHDLSRMWQDTGKTTPVTAVEQNVNAVVEMLGRDLFCPGSASFPVLKSDSTRNGSFFFDNTGSPGDLTGLASALAITKIFDNVAKTGAILSFFKFANATTSVEESLCECVDNLDSSKIVRLYRDANEKIVVRIVVDDVEMLKITSSVTVNNTNWHCLVVKFAPGSGQCYLEIDGVQTTGTMGASFVDDGDVNLFVGLGIKQGFEDSMRGQLSAFTTYSAIPTAQEILNYKSYNPLLQAGAFNDFEVLQDVVQQVIGGSPVDSNFVKDSAFSEFGSITVNYNVQLTTTAEFCTFISQNPAIATVDASGYVQWVSNGSVGIVCQAQNSIKTVNVAVSQSVVPATTFTHFMPGSLGKHLADAIDTRIAGKTVANKPIYTSQDHVTPAYVRSTTSWPHDLDLTCISPWNSFQGVNRAGTMITKKHLVVAAHYFLGLGETVRFVAANNTVVTRTITSYLDVTGTDTRIHVLDSEVPASIGFAKVLPAHYRDYMPGIRNGMPGIALDQEEKALVDELAFTNSTQAFMNCQVPVDSQRLVFYEPIIVGDSGNPMFLIVNNELVILTCWQGGGAGSGPFYADQITQINANIETMSPGGGYALTQASLSSFIAYYSRPISTASSSAWTGTAYTNFNQPIFAPSSGNAPAGSASGSGGNFSLNMTPPKKDCTRIIVNIRGLKQGFADPTVSLTIAGVTTAAKVCTIGSSLGWTAVAFDGNWTAANFDSQFKVNVFAGTMGPSGIRLESISHVYTENI